MVDLGYTYTHSVLLVKNQLIDTKSLIVLGLLFVLLILFKDLVF